MTEQIKAEIHYDSLYRFAVSLTRQSIDAEDLVHQTYLKWLKNRDAIRDTDRTKSWLFTTLHREFLHSLKTKTKHTLMETEQLEMLAPGKSPDTGNKLDAEYVMALMQRVPEPFRASLSLFYIQDFSYREIAEVLDVAPGTVMSRIFRGKQILKELMTTIKHGQPAESGGGAS
ncbi:MAG: RNA polymerase sigma factor [Pontiella sp.]